MISKAYFRNGGARATLAGFLLLLTGAAPGFAAQTEARPAEQQAPATPVDYIELLGFIDKPSARFLIDQVHKAEANDSAALVVRIDSPGGLAAPVKEIVRTVRSARVPVVAWVGPSGAEAGSAAAFIAAAAKITAIAPKASVGPALPADLALRANPGGADDRRLFQSLVSAKENSSGGLSGAVAARPATGAQARRIGLADITASNLPRLLNELDGRKVRMGDAEVTLPRRPFTLRFHKMPLGPRLLHSALRPSIAYMLIIIGIFGFIFEMYHPGIGAAAVCGALSFGFGLYSMTVLPTNWTAAVLLMLSLGLFLVELHRSSLGLFSLTGAAAFFGASLTLFSGPAAVFDLKWWVIAQGAGIVLLFYFFIMPAAFRSQLTPAADVAPLVGLSGVAETDLSPQGKVKAGGSTWQARTFGAAIPEGAGVVVKGASGMMLIVEEAKGEAAGAEAPAVNGAIGEAPH